MKKKDNGMSPDMLNDAMSSTSIPVFTTTNEGNKNESQNPLQKQKESNSIQKELIKVDFDKQTVSARALYHFFGLAERFSAWWTRMVSYGLEENVDFATVGKTTVVNNGGTKEIGDYLLTIEAAKNIAMIQRCEKGKQARQYFINIEKLFLNSVKSTQTTSKTPVSLFENLRSIASQCESYLQQMQEDYASKTDGLEKQCLELSQQKSMQNLQIERSVDFLSQKVEIALNDFVTEVANKGVSSVSTSPKASYTAHKFPHIYQLWYSELSEVFSTTDAELIGLKYNISRTTIFRLLRNQDFNPPLFRKLRYGKYEKLHAHIN